MDATGSTADCTSNDWSVIVQPQYESGGTWYVVSDCAGDYWISYSDICYDHNLAGGGRSCPDQFSSGTSTFDDSWDSSQTASCKNAEDVDQALLPGGQPLCHFNWKLWVSFYGPDGGFIQVNYGSELAKSC